MVAPTRSLATLLSAIVARVFLPIVTFAAPVPTNTSFLPETLNDAVHLPTHLIAPAPYAAPAALHLPVFELFSPATNLPATVNSPALPFPKQSNTCAVPAMVAPAATFTTGAFFTDDD